MTMNRTRASRLSLHCAGIAVLVVFFGGTAMAHIPPAFEAELAAMGREIALAVKGQGEDSVSIGRFSHPTLSDVSGGTGITKVLSDALEREGIAVKRRANLGLTGEFLDVTNDSDRLGAKIIGNLVDSSGEILLTFHREIGGLETIATLFGVTAELPPNQTGRIREVALKERIDKPDATIREGTRISAGPDSPYAIEIWLYDGSEYAPLPSVLESGQAFVKISRDELYAINLINDSPHDVAVQLTIDGLSIFAFSENQDYRHVIVPANKQGFIKGWHRSNLASDAFQVMEYSKSACRRHA